MKTRDFEYRKRIYDQLESGEIDFRRAVAGLRKSMGLAQADFAKKIGIAPRVLIDFERGQGNPTLSTLQKIGAPLGFEITFRRKLRAGLLASSR